MQFCLPPQQYHINIISHILRISGSNDYNNNSNSRGCAKKRKDDVAAEEHEMSNKVAALGLNQFVATTSSASGTLLLLMLKCCNMYNMSAVGTCISSQSVLVIAAIGNAYY